MNWAAVVQESHFGDADRLPLRRGFKALRMTNSYEEFDDSQSMDYWEKNRDIFRQHAGRMLRAVAVAEKDIPNSSDGAP